MQFGAKNKKVNIEEKVRYKGNEYNSIIILRFAICHKTAC